MSKKQVNHIVRAWKDADYRASLSAEEMAQLPQNPVGMFGLSVEELGTVHAGGIASASPACLSRNPTCSH